ncbi:hypothetical protein CHS0354_026727 [Potamilus streckersoni]|uniref:tRNA-binding domain-containing protein n=1 Tax=Potamilus streckersoni TaxID=2493646 RepID=A0AAE0RN03_9BIVA|nr:hypothetical protein CHS0354_026727 [Potamilus streckersoni]
MSLQLFTERARLAETIIIELRNQIESLKQAAVVDACKLQEERLRQENVALRKKLDALKVRMMIAEIRNGVKQVPLPVRNFSTSAAVAKEIKAEPANGANESKTISKPAQKEGKGKDKVKGEEGKAPADQEPPGKKCKTEKKGAEEAASEKMDVSRLDFRIGKIISVKKHPDADSLYVEEVDLGEGKTRSVVSGLVKHVPIEEMQDRIGVFMCNLKPAKMRGIMSEAMIMCANGPDRVEILVPPAGSQIGERVKAADYPGEPDAQLNPKKKIWETVKPDLRTDNDRVAAYKGSPLSVEGRGVVVAPTQANAQIS